LRFSKATYKARLGIGTGIEYRRDRMAKALDLKFDAAGFVLVFNNVVNNIEDLATEASY